MKLRISHHSLRIRLSQKEMQTLMSEGRLEDFLPFGPEATHHLRYTLQVATPALLRPELESQLQQPLQAQFTAGQIMVQISPASLQEWANSAQVALSTQQSYPHSPYTLHVLIEKDLQE